MSESGPTEGQIVVRTATRADLDGMLDVERRAFGGDVEAELVRSLVQDDGVYVAELCLLAEDEYGPIGHMMFTRARTDEGVTVVLLAPLAVVPERQRTGIGSLLVREGLARAARSEFDVALVLGDPAYYRRFGFAAATPAGILPPYPVEPEEAWMAIELAPGSLAHAAGRLIPARAFQDPALWRE